MQVWHDISAQISAVTNTLFKIKESRSIGGGCINQTYGITDGARRYFVKLNTAESLIMFEAEAAGLVEIHQSQTLRVPLPVCYGHNDQAAWLVLEYLSLNGGGRGRAADLGMQLAAMHRTTSKQFGWVRDNTIGQTLQINTLSSDWVNFWRMQRLGFQLDLAKTNGHNGKLQKLGEQLLIDLDKFFPGAAPLPALLHGDLWSGNYAYDDSGNPVLFDPAVYYGDREADIAMTELFGGFPADFYSAYRYDYPLDSGYNIRKLVYNLYHILNHLNLFGSSYRHQTEQTINTLLAEIR
ncbi:fructosamine kinase family protein [Nitrosomonas oligotropha]|uniref:fructosamine kinase family protein n=1 Tax=Nitrosomonas oligotropha TaxID=42354 RepID=UPI00136BAE65|nr:fructosamine kinase family protein [Nitrosomonas oligotropha]MXS83601.1 fructosamine kinase family protein [Nitrosomonas oligotropha]